MRFLSAFLLSALVVAGLGCDAGGSDYVEQVVVSGTLVTGEPLRPLQLVRTAPLTGTFDPAALVIDEAEVSVVRLAADGSAAERTPYAFDGAEWQPAPADAVPVAEAGVRYRLEATVPASEVDGGATITAETTVPEAIVVTVPPATSVPYQQGNGPALTIETSSSAERQSVYLISTAALASIRFEEVVVDGETRYLAPFEDDRFLPVPFILTFGDCEIEADGVTCEEDVREFDEGQSPLINEESYVLNGDGTAIVEIPWLAFRYFGPARVSLFSVDQAVEDFVSTQAVQFGGSSLSPGEIPNITTNVVGGLGLFGAYAQLDFELFVDVPEF